MKYIIILVISFIIEGIICVLLPFLNPLLTLIALIYASLYSKIHTNNLIKIGALVGFLYDVVYMHTCLINMLIYILIVYYLKKIEIRNSWKITVIVESITIVSYVLILYVFMLYSNHFIFNWYLLLKSLGSALINTIYLMLLLIIFNRSKQRKINIYYYR